MSNGKPESLVINEENNTIQLATFDDIWKLSSLLIKSNLFGTKNTSEVATKIITGLEMGISPVRAVRHIDTIEGKPSVSAQLSAAMIEMAPHYRYEIEECSIEFNEDFSDVVDGRCAITIYKKDDNKDWKKRGTTDFTWGEAVHAGLTRKNNWSNYPRDMLFARAMKRAKKYYASSVGIGREYMPDELGYDEAPTVEVPDKAVEEATSKDTTDGTTSKGTTSKGEPIKEPDYEVEEDSKPTKDSSHEGVPSRFNMEVTSEPTSEGTPKEPPSEGEDEDIPNHDDRLDESERINNRLNDLDESLSNLSGRALLYEIGKYHYQILNDWKDEYESKGLEVILKHEDRLDLPYDDRRGEVSYPTQKIINDADTALSNLSGYDLKEQIQNYKNEAKTWDSPASDIFLGVTSRHEERLDIQGTPNKDIPGDEGEPEGEPTNEGEPSGGISKGEKAEFHEGIERAKTKLGMKLNDTHHPEPLQKYIRGITKKAEEKPHTDKQWNKLQRVAKTYSTVVQLRSAVIPEGDKDEDPNIEVFNRILSDFAETLNEWGDDWANQSYEIVKGEAERLSDEVEGFEVSFN